jgi:hypothetical protein
MTDKVFIDKTDRFTKSSENELVDLMRTHVNYMRSDNIWDQLNRGGKLTIIALILISNFLIMLISALGGLV